MFNGRIVAAREICYASAESKAFKLSELRDVVTELGSGRHECEHIRETLEARLGCTVEDAAFVAALDQLERKQWITLHEDDTVEVT